MIEHDTGGHPTRGLKWCRTTPAKIAAALRQVGVQVGASTVRRLLTGLLGYSLRVNHKKIESGNRNPPPRKVRDAQFHYIDDMRALCARRGLPCISVDTKKKELIGNFKNNGRAWKDEPIAVYDHDFPSDAAGKIVPFGIYDTQANLAFVNVGISGDPPPWRSTRLSTGGRPSDRSASHRPPSCWSWLTLVAPIAHAPECGSTVSRSSCAMAMA